MSSDPKQRANDLEPEEINAPKAHKRGGKRAGAGRKPGPWAGKPWRDALIRAAKRRDPVTGYRMLELAAMRVVKEAVQGEDRAALAAATILGDRIDGKAHGNTGEGQARVSFVVHMPAQLAPEQWQRASGRMIEAQAMTPQDVSDRGDETRHLDAVPDLARRPHADAPSYTVLDATGRSEEGTKEGSNDDNAR